MTSIPLPLNFGITGEEWRYRDGRTSFPDPIILNRATELDRVLFSQDDDFLVEATRRQQEKINFSGVIYAHKLRVSVGDCIRGLEIIAKAAYPEELVN